MPESLQDALEQCWQRLAQGESLEQCLAEYPQFARELRELLVVAERQAALLHRPTPEFQTRLLRRTLREVRRQREARRPSWWHRLPFAMLRWAAAAAAVLLLVFAGDELAWATEESSPGSPLYPVKEAREQVRLAFIGSPNQRAQFQNERAERRVTELQRVMTSRQQDRELSMALRRMENHLEQALNATQQAQGEERRQLLRRLARLIERADQELAELEQRAQGPALAETQRLRQRLLQIKQRIEEQVHRSGSDRIGPNRAPKRPSQSKDEAGRRIAPPARPSIW